MRNKYRLSIMIVLIIMLFMYIMGIVGLADKSNFAFTLAALILSISMSVDTFAKQNKIAEGISFILEVLALLIIVMIPNLKDFVFFKEIDEGVRYQCFIDVSFIFYLCRSMGYGNKDKRY